MTVELTTVLDAPPDRVWAELQRPALLHYVAWPLLAFEPVDPPTFPERWTERAYRVRLRAFGVAPAGWQLIRIEQLPTEAGPGGLIRRIRDNGQGGLVRQWDHVVTVAPLSPDRTRYMDRVEVEAGPLTPLVGAFARVFYAHRQRRWQRLVGNGFRYDA